MKLYLCRHGTALSQDEDPACPLSEQGRSEVQTVAALLGEARVRVDRAWHSGKPRAAQTAQILARVMLPRGEIEAVGGIDPNDSVDEFIADIDVWQEDTLVVGHLPFMPRLLSALLLGEQRRELVQFTPGSIACLERDAQLHWRLAWMLRPDLLMDPCR